MATRDLTSALLNALDDAVVYPFFAVDLMFDDNATSSPIYMWTGIGTVSIGGKDYVGLGELLSIATIEESGDIGAKGANLTISGIPAATNIALALTEPYQGRVARIYFGVMGETASYSEIFSGFMDQMNINEGPETSSIEITIENKLIDLERARNARFTSAYQKSIYPNDKGLEFVESLQDKEIVWGRSVK
jgi:hypothetical protein